MRNYCVQNNLSWQYNGVASFSTIIDWCHDTFGRIGWHSDGMCMIYFHDENTKSHFLLRWGI